MNDDANSVLNLTLIKGLVGVRLSHRACVRGLGFRRRGETIQVLDSLENRGLINKISYLLKVEK